MSIDGQAVARNPSRNHWLAAHSNAG